MTDENIKINGGFHTLGDVLVDLLGADPLFDALQKVRTDPFRGHHLGEISDYEAMKANLANEHPDPSHYEGRIRTYAIERKI